MKNERTSKRIATIAAKFIAMKPDFDFARDMDGQRVSSTKFCMVSQSEWRQMLALAASALTQAPDNSQVAKAMRGELGTKKRKVPR